MKLTMDEIATQLDVIEEKLRMAEALPPQERKQLEQDQMVLYKAFVELYRGCDIIDVGDPQLENMILEDF